MLFVGLLSLGIYAQDATAKIEFKSETIDYGEIAKGSDGVRVFDQPPPEPIDVLTMPGCIA